jgi:hypothetical protein
MAYKTFVSGDPLTASELNTYLMDQTVMVFTNATARDTALPSPTEGMFAYLTASDHYTIYNGTSWIVTDTAFTAYTPTFTNIPTPTTTSAAYYRVGKLVHFYIYVVMSGAPTGLITATLPVTATSAARSTYGARMSPGGTTYLGVPIPTSTTAIALYAVNTAGTYASVTATSATVPGAWVAGNTWVITGVYEGV